MICIFRSQKGLQRDRTELLAKVLKPIEPGLTGTDQIDVPVTVHVDGGHLQAGPCSPPRKIFQGPSVFGLLRGVWSGVAMEDGVLVPDTHLADKLIIKDDRRIGSSRLGFVGIDPLARD